MTAHLSDDDLTEYLLGAPGAGIDEHLRSCPDCRQEADDVSRSLTAFKSWTHENAAVMTSPRYPAPLRGSEGTWGTSNRVWLSWAAAVALVVIAVALMLVPGSAPRQQVSQQVAQPDADDALLMQVQQDLESSVPRALVPAEMLAAERNRVIVEARQARNQ